MCLSGKAPANKGFMCQLLRFFLLPCICVLSSFSFPLVHLRMCQNMSLIFTFWWLALLLSIRQLHGEARNVGCRKMTFTAMLFVPESDRCYSLLLVSLSPFLCYISFVQFIPKISDPLSTRPHSSGCWDYSREQLVIFLLYLHLRERDGDLETQDCGPVHS